MRELVEDASPNPRAKGTMGVALGDKCVTRSSENCFGAQAIRSSSYLKLSWRNSRSYSDLESSLCCFSEKTFGKTRRDRKALKMGCVHSKLRTPVVDTHGQQPQLQDSEACLPPKKMERPKTAHYKRRQSKVKFTKVKVLKKEGAPNKTNLKQLLKRPLTCHGKREKKKRSGENSSGQQDKSLRYEPRPVPPEELKFTPYNLVKVDSELSLIELEPSHQDKANDTKEMDTSGFKVEEDPKHCRKELELPSLTEVANSKLPPIKALTSGCSESTSIIAMKKDKKPQKKGVTFVLPVENSDEEEASSHTSYSGACDGMARPPTRRGMARPPTRRGMIRPTAQDGMVRPTTHCKMGRPPTRHGMGRPPTRHGMVRPPTQHGMVHPPTCCKMVRPPERHGMVCPPERHGMVRPPEQHGIRPPEQHGICPPERHGMVRPPEQHGIHPPERHGMVRPPERHGNRPPEQHGIRLPEQHGIHLPERHGMVHPPERHGMVRPPTRYEMARPPTFEMVQAADPRYFRTVTLPSKTLSTTAWFRGSTFPTHPNLRQFPLLQLSPLSPKKSRNSRTLVEDICPKLQDPQRPKMERPKAAHYKRRLRKTTIDFEESEDDEFDFDIPTTSYATNHSVLRGVAFDILFIGSEEGRPCTSQRVERRLGRKKKRLTREQLEEKQRKAEERRKELQRQQRERMRARREIRAGMDKFMASQMRNETSQD